jgi:hypothetical protein
MQTVRLRVYREVPTMTTRWLLYGMLVLISGCASAAEYQAAQAAWEAREAQGPANCPATRRSNGTCIRDGP